MPLTIIFIILSSVFATAAAVKQYRENDEVAFNIS